MTRWISTCVAAALTSAAIVGCDSSNYQPNADTAQLSSYAANDKYPTDLQSTPAENIFYSVGGDGTITLNNAGDRTLGGFDLWVNKSFVVMVDKLPAHTHRNIAANLIYNNGGSNLSTVPVESISAVQIREAGQLKDVKGPVKT